MAIGTTRANAGVVHRPGFKAAGNGGVGMASLARSRCRNVVRGFAHYYRAVPRGAGVAGGTTRGIVTVCGVLHHPIGGCKADGGGMAPIALKRGWDMR